MASNGCVIAGTPIAVDCWQPALTSRCTLFFLTHAHADHTKGLTAKWKTKFYTSVITARIVMDKFGITADLICVLSTGESYILPLGDNSTATMTVTLFDANHCPGSVMYLFQGGFGNILYTGDFRYDDGIPPDINHCCRIVDHLYLDNTFANKRFQFLPRSLERLTIVQIIRENSDCRVKIGVRSLGKENLLTYIANSLNTRIVVSNSHLKMLELLEMKDIFITNPNISRIHAIPLHIITSQQVDKWNEECHTIAILPSGLPKVVHHERIFAVPYSDHSPLSELHAFVRHIRPKKVFPIVKNDLGTSDMSMFNQYRNYASEVLCADKVHNSHAKRGNNLFCTTNSSPSIKSHNHRRKLISGRRFLARQTSRRGVNFTDDLENKCLIAAVPPGTCKSELDGTEQGRNLTEHRILKRPKPLTNSLFGGIFKQNYKKQLKQL